MKKMVRLVETIVLVGLLGFALLHVLGVHAVKIIVVIS